MTTKDQEQPFDSQRRLTIASRDLSVRPLRWGIVGTGNIANSMAKMIQLADFAELVSVASRRRDSAKSFAAQHNVTAAFDSWKTMIESNQIDAIYVATPTGIREEICLFAASQGKHVLGEKPFANLQSLQRITAACDSRDLVFMDGTHFVHHPRTAQLQRTLAKSIGSPRSLATAFQFSLTDRNDIRYNRNLEPYGAIGDAGWYNMRAAVEYLPLDIELAGVKAYMRRDKSTGATVNGSGVMYFSDGSTSTWHCGFDCGAKVMDLRVSAAGGVISLADFLINDADGSASFVLRTDELGTDTAHRVDSTKPGPALMFDNFAAAVVESSRRRRSINASEQTQRWLDAAWKSALENTS